MSLMTWWQAYWSDLKPTIIQTIRRRRRAQSVRPWLYAVQSDASLATSSLRAELHRGAVKAARKSAKENVEGKRSAEINREVLMPDSRNEMVESVYNRNCNNAAPIVDIFDAFKNIEHLA
ncbi:hypothetical protein B0A48_18534 [Cryoendolithus antarcticus]|uniref:Uncharacterized protein n=1 Tax=Cryoendolithus antarcticus TaxID=1507870 RepID=A0A1V8S9G9_9PEZI|nr:hypothetical protein B0A48_18534 [Cryoendolithus antarcticus]